MMVAVRILLLLFLCYLAIVLFVVFFQGRMIYYPDKGVNSFPSDVDLAYREVTLKTSDGVHINGWLVGDDKDRDVVLFCHGNAGNISHRLDTLALFHGLGLNSFIFDYRGYGRSRGKPTEEGTYLDAEAAWRYLVEKEHIQPGRIILFGRSLGGAVAAHLAAKTKKKAKALILESAFTSVPDMGAHYYPYLPVRLLSRFRYDNKKFLREITLPVLVIHSPNDEIVPFKHGQALYEAANEPKKFLQIAGSHCDGFLDTGETYINGLKEFLNSIAKLPKSSNQGKTLKINGH